MEIIHFARNLAALDLINYGRIDAETMAASSENQILSRYSFGVTPNNFFT